MYDTYIYSTFIYMLLYDRQTAEGTSRAATFTPYMMVCTCIERYRARLSNMRCVLVNQVPWVLLLLLYTAGSASLVPLVPG